MAGKKLREVVCLIFYKDGKLLLEQRLDRNEFEHRWTFTGGKVEPEDTLNGHNPLITASIREAGEETGLVPLECEVLASFEEASRTGEHFLFHAVKINKWKGKVENKEPARRELSWIPLAKAQEFIGDTEVDKRVLELFKKTHPA